MIKLLRLINRALRPSGGQMIVLFVAILTVTFVAGLISVDVGWWLSDRHAATKAADLASLAGSQSLLRHANRTDMDQTWPSGAEEWWRTDEKTAINDACNWAALNGYTDGKDDVEVDVQLFCDPKTTNLTGICSNTGGSPIACSPKQECASVVLHEEPQVTTPGCDSISVTVSKPATYVFGTYFGLPGKLIARGAAAGLQIDVVPLRAMMTIDRTGSMNGNPLTQAKIAARNFTDYLLSPSAGGAQTLVGMVPYNECYRPPLDSNNHCTQTSWIAGLTNSQTTVDGKINSLTADWGTNICLGLYETNQTMLAVPLSDPNTEQAVVLLSDGQNQYSTDSYSLSLNAPPPECRPSDPSELNCGHSGQPACDQTGNGCFSAQPHQRDLDRETNALVNGPGGLKARGIDVYVVGFGVCGNSTTDPHYNDLCNPSMIGTNTNDNSANRNLLKCLASSAPGTNDHYYEVPNASDLPNIFQAIAWAISGRSLTQ